MNSLLDAPPARIEDAIDGALSIAPLLRTGALTTLFQPIFGLRSVTPLGFEALTRGPAGHPLHSPGALFSAAARDGLLHELECACWASALERGAAAFRERTVWTNLFVNVLPDEFDDPDFLLVILRTMERFSVLPSQVVVEITEGSRIEDYERTRRRINEYRAHGLRFAIDDAGSGHSGLQTIVELAPDFVKVDKALIDGIDSHPAKYFAVQALGALTRRLGIGLIAEGIETAGELAAVRDLELPYAQGFLLGEPSTDPVRALQGGMLLLRDPGPASRRRPSARRTHVIRDIAIQEPAISPDWSAGRVYDEFRQRDTDGLVIVQDGRPVGLLMRADLERQLSRPFGREVYLRRPVTDVMNRTPLLVDAQRGCDDVALAAMERTNDAVYDHIVVTSEDRYLGVVSVRRLLESVTEAKVASARSEHPLTGLPGSPAIQDEVSYLLQRGQTFSLVYFDLDNFKAFNDRYGFHHGDRAIRLLARLIGDALASMPVAAPFVGHVGGDDFIVITDHSQGEELAEMVRAALAVRIPELYDATDRQRGFLEAESRSGTSVRVPLMTVTAAVLDCAAAPGESAASLLEQLALVKADAKRAARLAASSVTVP